MGLDEKLIEIYLHGNPSILPASMYIWNDLVSFQKAILSEGHCIYCMIKNVTLYVPSSVCQLIYCTRSYDSSLYRWEEFDHPCFVFLA